MNMNCIFVAERIAFVYYGVMQRELLYDRAEVTRALLIKAARKTNLD